MKLQPLEQPTEKSSLWDPWGVVGIQAVAHIAAVSASMGFMVLYVSQSRVLADDFGMNVSQVEFLLFALSRLTEVYWPQALGFTLFANPLILLLLRRRAPTWLRAVWFVGPLLLAPAIILAGFLIMLTTTFRIIDTLPS